MHSPNGRHEYIGDNEEEKGEEDKHAVDALKRALQKSLFFFDEEEATGEVDVGVARTPLKPVQPSSLVKLTERKELAMSPLTLRSASERRLGDRKGPEQMKNRLRQEALRQEETEESRGARETCRKAEEFETTKSKLSFDTKIRCLAAIFIHGPGVQPGPRPVSNRVDAFARHVAIETVRRERGDEKNRFAFPAPPTASFDANDVQTKHN